MLGMDNPLHERIGPSSHYFTVVKLLITLDLNTKCDRSKHGSVDSLKNATPRDRSLERPMLLSAEVSPGLTVSCLL